MGLVTGKQIRERDAKITKGRQRAAASRDCKWGTSREHYGIELQFDVYQSPQ